jgi:cytidyltransferase-like protein
MDNKTYYLVSGGFDPIHEGHIALINAAAKKSDGVIVLLNSTEWLKRKKGKEFMTALTRRNICENLKNVIDVLEFDDADNSASDGIARARAKYPDAKLVFANGGDRTKDNIPEHPACEKYNVGVEFGVGGENKANSSSWITKQWADTSPAKNSAPKISTIVPVYKIAPWLGQCLESLIRQSYKNLEIIIVDDGSPDNSAQVYEKYAAADSRIKIIKQPNTGVSVARNNGLAAATGDYVHFMDGDDWLDLDYYEKMISGIVNADADIAASGINKINDTAPNIEYKSEVILLNLQEKLTLLKLPRDSFSWRYLFRRDFLMHNNLHFPPGMIMREDTVFMLQCVRASGRLVIVPHVMYNYLQRPGSAWKQNSDKNAEDYRYADRFASDFFHDNQVSGYYYSPRVRTYILLGIKLAKVVTSGDTSRYYLFGMRTFKKITRNET